MGFKLGREKGLHVSNGEIKNKMRFTKEHMSIPGTPIIRKKLGEGIFEGVQKPEWLTKLSKKIYSGIFFIYKLLL